MTEENNPGSEAVGLPPTTQKTKEQWLEEGKVLMFYAPIRYEEALAAFEQALRLDPNDGLTYRMKGMALRALRRMKRLWPPMNRHCTSTPPPLRPLTARQAH